MALDDHCLADLGIRRSEINAYLAAGRRRDEIAPALPARQKAVLRDAAGACPRAARSADPGGGSFSMR
jgi:hypothetical protein